MTMLSKCANPACAAAFDYRQGRLFRFAVAGQHPVQHFWFCEVCAEAYTLHLIEGQGVSIGPRSTPVGARPARTIEAA